MTELLTIARLRDLINDNPDYPQETKQFYKFLISNKLDLNPEGVKSYVEYLTASEYAPNSIRVKISAVKSCIRFLFDNSEDSLDIRKRIAIDDYLNKKLKLPKINSRAVDIDLLPTEENIKFLIRKVSPRLGLIIEFLYYTGSRISEATMIKLADIKTTPKYYKITIRGKGDKYRDLMVSKELVEKIKEVYTGEVYLFETSQNKTKTVTGGHPVNRTYITNQIKKASIKWLECNMSSHTFRHCFATKMIKEGKSVKAVSVYLGHSSVQTTLDLYVHDNMSYEDLFFYS